MARPPIRPRARVLYLLAVAVGVFVVEKPAILLGVFAVQATLWLSLGLGARRLGRQISKLWLFSAFVVVSYALFAHDATDRWIEVPHLGLSLNLAGALAGAMMVVRVLSVVLASQVARAGDPRAVSLGLASLRVPDRIAVSLDVVLALLGDAGGGGRGRGDGSGGGRGRGRGGRGRGRGGEGADGGFWTSVKRLARGDVGPLVDRLERQIRRAEDHVTASGVAVEIRRDVAIIAGVVLAMMMVKVLKVLPSLPFAPGHKLVLLTPLYIAAGMLTRSRWGATITGVVMGTVAFLLGDGRYGIFEILKHVAPGLVCDALLPLLLRRDRVAGAGAFAALGAAMGLGRFATIFVVTLAVQPPAVAYAFLVPGLALNAFFGLVSGWVSHHVARAALELRARLARDDSADEPEEPRDDEKPSPGRKGGTGKQGSSRRRAEAIG